MKLVLGMVLKFVLDRLGIRGGRALASGAHGRGGTVSAAAPERAAPSVPRRPLLLFMFAMLGLGLLLMLIFEHWLTRILGVTALFAFIVSGVFLIADPAFLAAADDGD
jgi:hypothetical protein